MSPAKPAKQKVEVSLSKIVYVKVLTSPSVWVAFISNTAQNMDVTRRLIVLSSIILVLLSAGVPIAGAGEAADGLMKKMMPKVTANFRNGYFGISNRRRTPTDYRPGYRIYVINLTKLRENAPDFNRVPINSVLKRDYRLEYPLVDAAGKVVSTASGYKDNNKWVLGSFTGDRPVDSVEFSSNLDEIKKALADQGINNITSVKHLTDVLGDWDYDFLYFEAPQGMYLMPLNRAPGAFELQDKKAYPAAEVWAKIAAARNDPPAEQGFYFDVLDSTQSLMDCLLRDPASAPPPAANNVMKKEMPSITHDYETRNRSVTVPTHFGLAYKVYGLSFTKIKNAGPHFGKGAISSIIGAEYVWAYPLLDSKGNFVISAWVTKVKGAWSLVALGSAYPPDRAFSYTGKELNKYLANKGIINAKHVKHVTAIMGMNFFYVETDRGRYFVPIDSASRSTELLGSGKVSAAKFLAKMYAALLPSKTSGGSSPFIDIESWARPRGSGGGTRHSTSRRSRWPAPFVGVFGILCLSGLAFALGRRFRRPGAG